MNVILFNANAEKMKADIKAADGKYTGLWIDCANLILESDFFRQVYHVCRQLQLDFTTDMERCLKELIKFAESILALKALDSYLQLGKATAVYTHWNPNCECDGTCTCTMSSYLDYGNHKMTAVSNKTIEYYFKVFCVTCKNGKALKMRRNFQNIIDKYVESIECDKEAKFLKMQDTFKAVAQDYFDVHNECV